MTKNLFGATALFILMVCGTIAQAKSFKARFAGAVTATEIDFAGNAQTAVEGEGAGTSNRLGKFVFHWLREWNDLPPESFNNRCKQGEIERQVLQNTMVFTDSKGKNQVFFRLAKDDTVKCFDPAGGIAGTGAAQTPLDIIGGTNRFENATGRVVMDCTGVRLAIQPGPEGLLAHGAVSCEMSGNIDF